ncbi:MAG: SLC13 family permease [Gammaproteobacteria bacterium]
MLITLITILAVLVALAATRIAPDVLLMGAVTVLILTGVLTPAQALSGFANTGLWTVGLLYVIAIGLQESGGIQWIAQTLFGEPRGSTTVRARLLVPAAGLSAFLNNTTVVAMLIPAVQQWAQKLGISPSKLLLPLSYAAIIGGTCTLIGTSTNLVIDGLLRQSGHPGLGIFEIAWVGVPLAVTGLAYLIFFSDRLLPTRGGVIDELERVREYAVEFEVDPAGSIKGRTIAAAGLRSLAHGYLAEIIRGDQVLSAVGPDTRLEAGDRLMFVGSPDCAKELRSIQGIYPASAGAHKLDIQHHQRCLVEAVISPDFQGIGKSIRELQFRTRYRAAVLSVYRAGETSERKIGDVRLQVGDTLLMETDRAFVKQYRSRRDFLLVSALNDSTPPDFSKAPRAVMILVAMVTTAALGVLSMLEAALLAAGAMLVSGCITVARARNGIDYSVLIVIGASFALGAAMTETGLAASAATMLTNNIATPLLALAVVYILTAVFTELITNNAAAVLMFGIAVAVAEQLGVSPMPFVVVVMFAASAAFMTPIGYQTNLMVMGPGGYRLADYLRVGAPMSLLAFSVTMIFVPLIWKF